ncbi:MAG: transposase [Paludibacteraceae bacterium]
MSKNYPERRSIRLWGYDYSQDGLYFITICTYNREPVFGQIADGEMQLNDAGIIVRDAWLETVRIRPNIVLGDFVVMPNHFHAVFAINNPISVDDTRHRRGVLHTPELSSHTPTLQLSDDTMCRNESSDVCRGLTGVCNTPLPPPSMPTTLQSPSQTVGAIVRGFKSMVSKRASYSVWQRNYHEHIIRNEQALHRISQYIVSNPARWQDDCFYAVQNLYDTDTE